MRTCMTGYSPVNISTHDELCNVIEWCTSGHFTQGNNVSIGDTDKAVCLFFILPIMESAVSMVDFKTKT